MKHSDLPGPDVRLVDLQTEKVFVPTQAEADVILKCKHPWVTFMSVFTGSDWDNYEMESLVEAAPHPCLHRDIVEQLNDSHQELLTSFDQDQVIGYGWIAMPSREDIAPEKARRLYQMVQKTSAL